MRNVYYNCEKYTKDLASAVSIAMAMAGSDLKTQTNNVDSAGCEWTQTNGFDKTYPVTASVIAENYLYKFSNKCSNVNQW